MLEALAKIDEEDVRMLKKLQAKEDAIVRLVKKLIRMEEHLAATKQEIWAYLGEKYKLPENTAMHLDPDSGEIRKGIVPSELVPSEEGL